MQKRRFTRHAACSSILMLLIALWAIPCHSQTLRGDYIGAVPGEGRSPLLRKSFVVKSRTPEAKLYVNSLGYHEAYLNGEKVSDAVLSPAVSQLDKRSLVVAYDVSRLLRKGENELVIWAGSGWYKPKTFSAQYEGPLVKVELDVRQGKGAWKPVVWTDASWEGVWSGYSDTGTWQADRFAGERIDARIVPKTLRHQDLESLAWGPVDVIGIEGIAASEQRCEPCRIQEVLRPVSIEPYGEDRWLVDFGRIVNGMCDITLPSLPAGHVTRVGYSDLRLKDGSLSYVTGFDRCISSGDAQGDRFTNRFNHHVFRYLRLDSLPTAPKLEDIKALRMRTDYQRTATFECSDEELNKIHDMIAYTLENLAFNGYMVDCANIERLGYGGDGNASTLSLQIMFGVKGLYDNWLQAWADVMGEDGGLPHTAPCPYPAGGGPYWCSFIVQAPWRTYMSYGDVGVLEKYYPFMKQWLRYVDAYTVDGLLRKWPDTNYRQWYLGDWAAPTGVDVSDPESVGLVNNCCMCQVYLDLEQIARRLGQEQEAKGFRQRYETLAKSIQEAFYHPETSTYGSGSQVDMAYPLLVGIVPKDLQRQVVSKLKERTETYYAGHLATGLVGVPVITEWATLAGECDWMYSMLKKHGYPGYLYMLDQGASATWEHWDSNRSRMHNCYNGIGSWFYQALGGIIPEEPGYRHVRIEPQVPKGLAWVKVTQDTPHGRIVVHREGKRLHVELPTGITATIRGKEYTSGSYDVELQPSCSAGNTAPPCFKASKVVAALHDPASKYVVVVAHRGDWRNWPENSLPAIESVIRMGVDVMELDLKMTKDSVLVLSHDETLDRCTTGSGRISDYTYQELLKFDLKRGHGIAIPGLKIPTLRQALEVCKDRIVVNVDQGYDYYDQVLAITEELGVTDQVLIKSGRLCSEVQEKFSQHPHNMMYMPVVGVSSTAKREVFNSYLSAAKPPLAFELCFGTLDEGVRKAARQVTDAGSKVWVNTIWGSLCGGYDDDRAFERVDPDEVYAPILDLGTSIIQTDRPEFLIHYLEQKGRR